MRLKLRALIRAEEKRTGVKPIQKAIAEEIGLQPENLSRMANGKVKSFRDEVFDVLSTYWTRKGYSLDEIWEFDEVEFIEPSRPDLRK